MKNQTQPGLLLKKRDVLMRFFEGSTEDTNNLIKSKHEFSRIMTRSL